MKKETSKADNFYKAPKDDHKKILEWCEREIEEYKKLIKFIKGKG